MAINIKFDLAGNPEPPTIILATRNGNKLGQLDVNHESIELIDKLNDASEFSFTLNKYVDGKVTNLWDKVVDFKRSLKLNENVIRTMFVEASKVSA